MSPPPTASAAEITRRSRSNLALAFVALPPARRRDISTFYAWCRVVDDAADAPGVATAQRRADLGGWLASLDAPQPGEPALAGEVRALRERYGIPAEHFREIIAGCEMDLEPRRYETWAELRTYCHRVASVVGLISVEIFGCRDPAAHTYARELGLALQLTNILRDVGEDWANGGRIYLPLAELREHGYGPGQLAGGRTDGGFGALMAFQAARARGLYAAAVAARPAGDRRRLVAAEIMRAVYGRLLARMERDGFRGVFRQRYRLGRLEKLALVAGGMLRATLPGR